MRFVMSVALFAAMTVFAGLAGANPVEYKNIDEKPLPLDGFSQYIMEISCTYGEDYAGEERISYLEFLKRTDRNQIFHPTPRTVASAKHAAHYAIVSDARTPRLKTNYQAKQMIANPATNWIEIFLISTGADGVVAKGDCGSMELLYGHEEKWISFYFASDSAGSSTVFVSAFLALATSIKDVLDRDKSTDTPSTSDPETNLSKAGAIVSAYQTFENALSEKKIITDHRKLTEGRNYILTGYSRLKVEIRKVPSFLLEDGTKYHFRKTTSTILSNAIANWTAPSDLGKNMKLGASALATTATAVDEISDACTDVDQLLNDAGITSPEDRTYIMSAYLKSLKAKPAQKAICIEAAELKDVALKNQRVRDLIAGKKGGLGKRWVLYQEDVAELARVRSVAAELSALGN